MLGHTAYIKSPSGMFTVLSFLNQNNNLNIYEYI